MRETKLKPYNLINDLLSRSRLLTIEEVATILCKSSCTVYRMAQKKQLPSLIQGGSRMFDPSVLAMHFSKKNPEIAVAARWARELAF